MAFVQAICVHNVCDWISASDTDKLYEYIKKLCCKCQLAVSKDLPENRGKARAEKTNYEHQTAFMLSLFEADAVNHLSF